MACQAQSEKNCGFPGDGAKIFVSLKETFGTEIA
jgi:hypothetical protein